MIFRNDQLLWVTLAMVLFMTGYTITTSLGLYYFTYIYGDVGMYPVFAAILGVSQIGGLLLFPLASARLGVAGVLLFAGQAFIQLLMMMFIADSVEYGQWKLGRRNESVTFSLQPFIYKAASALASGAIGVTLIFSGINDADSAADITDAGALAFKVVMMVIPLVLVVVSWLVLARRYRLDEARYAEIITDLRLRESTLGAPDEQQ